MGYCVCGQIISIVRSILLYKKQVPMIEKITQEERWDDAVMLNWRDATHNKALRLTVR
jgi:hypothetical protein